MRINSTKPLLISLIGLLVLVSYFLLPNTAKADIVDCYIVVNQSGTSPNVSFIYSWNSHPNNGRASTIFNTGDRTFYSISQDYPSGIRYVDYHYVSDGTYNVSLFIQNDDLGSSGGCSTQTTVTVYTPPQNGTINVTTNWSGTTYTSQGPTTFQGVGGGSYPVDSGTYSLKDIPPNTGCSSFSVSPSSLDISAGDSKTFTITYTVAPPPCGTNTQGQPTGHIYCNNLSSVCDLNSGDSAVISWDSKYADNCTVYPYYGAGNGWEGTSGTKTDSTPATRTVQLNCWNSEYWNTVATVQVNVNCVNNCNNNGGGGNNNSVTITCDEKHGTCGATAGQNVTIAWTSNAGSCVGPRSDIGDDINPGGAGSGSSGWTVPGAGSYNFVVSCGGASDNVTVVVGGGEGPPIVILTQSLDNIHWTGAPLIVEPGTGVWLHLQSDFGTNTCKGNWVGALAWDSISHSTIDLPGNNGPDFPGWNVFIGECARGDNPDLYTDVQIIDYAVPATVTLNCNGVHGSCSVNSGSAVSISWSSSQTVASCVLYANGQDSGWHSTSGNISSGPLTTTTTYTENCTGTQGGSASDSLTVTVNTPTPTASNTTEYNPNYCQSGPGGTIGWTYSDPLGSPQTKYQVQVGANGNFGSPVLDSGQINSSSNLYAIPGGVLQFNTNYQARVRVWNSSGTVSAWSNPGNWTTPPYAYPQTAFTWSPNKPGIGSVVQFTDQTTFGAGGNHQWGWTFGDGGSAGIQNPTHAYAGINTYTVNEIATDAAGQSCSVQHQINIQKAIPSIKEVAPK